MILVFIAGENMDLSYAVLSLDKKVEKLLNNFKGINGLDDVVGRVLELENSEIYAKVHGASVIYDKLGFNPSQDVLVDRHIQYRYAASCLRDPILNIYPLTDVIIFPKYCAVTGILKFIDYAYTGKKLSIEDLDRHQIILERLMVFLYDFDELKKFKSPDEEFYRKLRKIKRDKIAKKLLGGLEFIRRDVLRRNGFKNNSTFWVGETFLLDYLAACSAVHQNRDEISMEDVIIAYKTYLKLLNTDISKLDINQGPAKLNDKPELIENPQKTNLNTVNSKKHSQGTEKEIIPNVRKGRKFIAVIAGIITFIGTGTLIALGVQNIWLGYSFSDHPFERLSLLFISFLVASFVYNLIKGDEPEVNEGQKMARDKVSKRLEEMRNSDKYITTNKPHTEIPESKVATVESSNYKPLNKHKSKIKENDLQKTDLSIVTPTTETYGSEIEKNVYSKPVETELRAIKLNEIENEPVKSISKSQENDIETVTNASQNILNEFKDVDGLEEIIHGIKDPSNSEIHEMFYKASKNKSRWNLELDNKVDELLQVKYANEILKNPIIYKPPKTDVIIGRNFYSAFLLINWIYLIHDPETNDTGYDKQSKILERVMSLLDDFDRIEPFKGPNEEFYKKLKNIKWDEEGESLHEKITSIHGDIVHEKLGIRRGRSIYLTEHWTLIFLAACNTVNQGRDKILPEDIVKAYKAYFKLLNTDITKLDVLREDLDQISPESNMESIETSGEELIKEKRPLIIDNNIQNSNFGSINSENAKIDVQNYEEKINPEIAKIEPKAIEPVVAKNEPLKLNLEFKEEKTPEIVKDNPQKSNINSTNSCPDCGGSNVAEAKYCAFCGSKLALKYASVIGRFFAFLIDGIILAIVSFIILVGVSLLYNGSDDIGILIWIISTILIGFLYFLIFEGPFMQGQTIGKMAVSVRVVDQKSMETISYSQSFIRNILRIIDLMPYILPYLLGFIIVLSSKENQRIGDMGAKTIVIKDSEKPPKH